MDRDISYVAPAGIFTVSMAVQPLALLAVQKVADDGVFLLPGSGTVVPAVAVAAVVQLKLSVSTQAAEQYTVAVWSKIVFVLPVDAAGA